MSKYALGLSYATNTLKICGQGSNKKSGQWLPHTLIGAAVASAAYMNTFHDDNTKVSNMEGNDVNSEAFENILQRLDAIEKKVATDAGAKASKAAAATAHGLDVVLGAQWGDEGKGKLVDLMSQGYDVCARVAGGSNAGHTIVANGTKYKFHLVPSGVLNPSAKCVIGNGVVVHIPSLLKELDDLERQGVAYKGRFFLSDRAHLVFDFHQSIDGLNEERLGRNKIGTTKKGIGPAYASKIVRNGVRVGDLTSMEYFEERFRTLVNYYKTSHPDLEVDVEAEMAYYHRIRSRVLELTTDTISLINREYDSGKKILVEGANATMLDIDFGTYPYVTSSNPSIGSVCTGLGVAPIKLKDIVGTVKAYCTRVGHGPFPTELEDETGELLRVKGGEFGTTTGRARRCGWLDIPQMRYSTLVNGFTHLNLTKLDVLTGMEEVKIGVGYTLGGVLIEGMPANLKTLGDVEIKYETLKGWEEDISKAKSFEDLPYAAQYFVLRVEELLGVPIRWIGIGQGREDVIDRGSTVGVGGTAKLQARQQQKQQQQLLKQK